MFTAQQFENLFFTLAMAFLVLYGIASLAETKPKWFLSKTFLKSKQMQQAYDKILQARKDMMHHYYWNKSNNSKSQMKKQEKEIIKLDKQLQEMRSEYEMVRKGLPVPLKMF